MKPVNPYLLAFVCSFALGVCISPVFKVKAEKEPVSEPAQKPIQHYRDRYGHVIKRTV